MATVISIGIHIVDILGRPVISIPPGQNVALLDEIRITVAGTAAGTSVDLAKLGAKVVAMGAVGTDELGNFLVNTMQSYGIDTTNLVRKAGVQSSATMLPIRPNGERPALHVPGANGEMTLADVNWEVIKAAQYLHMGGTSLMPKFDGQPTMELLKFAHQHGVVTSFDLVAVERPDLLDLIEPCLPYIDYFMPSLDEAQMMMRLAGHSYQSRQDVIDFFLDRGAKHTVLKMGAQGSSIASKAFGEIRLPAFKVAVVDTKRLVQRGFDALPWLLNVLSVWHLRSRLLWPTDRLQLRWQRDRDHHFKSSEMRQRQTRRLGRSYLGQECL